MIEGAFKKPFAEQAEFFRRKLALPSTVYDDIARDSHDHGFIVAGATKAALVADLKAAMQKAHDEGKSIQWFRQEFASIVQKRGWRGWTGQGTETGEAWRTRIIYTTNLRTSYAAGRYAQMTDPDVLAARPYWQYVHRLCTHPRQEHLSWNGLTLPATDPWWQTHWPPNGYGCHCIVESLSLRQLQKQGKSAPDTAPADGMREHLVTHTGELVILPKGIDYGWDYAPGRSAVQTALAARANQLVSLDAAIARLSLEALTRSDLFGRFVAGQIGGEFPVALLSDSAMANDSSGSAVVIIGHEQLDSHLTVADYRQLQTILDQGERDSAGGFTAQRDGIAYRVTLTRSQGGHRQALLSKSTRKAAS